MFLRFKCSKYAFKMYEPTSIYVLNLFHYTRLIFLTSFLGAGPTYLR